MGISRRFALGLFVVTALNYAWHYFYSVNFPPGMPWDALIASTFVVASWPRMPPRAQLWLYGFALFFGGAWLWKWLSARLG